MYTHSGLHRITAIEMIVIAEEGGGKNKAESQVRKGLVTIQYFQAV